MNDATIVTRVFFDLGKKGNKPLAKALDEARKRPSALTTPAKYPKLAVNHLEFTHASDDMYVWHISTKLEALPTGMKNLTVDHVEVDADLPIAIDFCTVASGTYRQFAQAGYMAEVSETAEELASGVKYRERHITMTGPKLAEANLFLDELRHGDHHLAELTAEA